MPSSVTSTPVGLPNAFATACRAARSHSELFERCRQALTQRFGSDQIWLSVTRDGTRPERGPKAVPSGSSVDLDPEADTLARLIVRTAVSAIPVARRDPATYDRAFDVGGGR